MSSLVLVGQFGEKPEIPLVKTGGWQVKGLGAIPYCFQMTVTRELRLRAKKKRLALIYVNEQYFAAEKSHPGPGVGRYNTGA